MHHRARREFSESPGKKMFALTCGANELYVRYRKTGKMKSRQIAIENEV